MRQSVLVDKRWRAAILAALILLPPAATPRAEEPVRIEAGQPGLLARFLGSYRDGLAQGLGFETAPPAAEPAADPPRRALASALAAPPFPSADFPGLTPPLGQPAALGGPLMAALAGTGFGRSLDDARIALYGWSALSYNASTSRHSNAPMGYLARPNTLGLDQAVLRIERLPDTVQTDHIDWGFRIAGLYGANYRFTSMFGIFDEQLKRPRYAGHDIPEFYADLYIPQVAHGMVIRVGRYGSIPDIETLFPVDNYLLTHSLMNVYDPFTMFGALATIQLAPQWRVQLGVNAGADTAPWERNARPTFTGCLRWSATDGRDAVYACANAVNDSRLPNSNVNHYVATWGHRFSEAVHMATELYTIFQRKPERGGSTASTGAVNYLAWRASPQDMLVLRNDVLDDPSGRRTGTRNTYSSHTLGYTRWLTDVITLRPELRYDHAWSRPAYDNGTRRGQFTFAVDLVTRF